MDPMFQTQHDLLQFRDLLSRITNAATTDADQSEVAEQSLILMRKHSASFDTINEMANILIKNAASLFPAYFRHSEEELLVILAQSRAGGSLYEQGLKGLLRNQFHYLSQTESAFILFFEYYCSECISASPQPSAPEVAALNMQAREIRTTIANLRTLFSNVAKTELTIDKTISMIQSMSNDIILTQKDIEDILTGKGRLTLCETKDSEEARRSAKQENIAYVIKDNKLTFSMRVGIDVNIEVEPAPRIVSYLRKNNISFVENKANGKYILDYTQYKAPSDFTFEQLIELTPDRNYFPKAVNCQRLESIPEGTFAKVIAYSTTGEIQTYMLPEPVNNNHLKTKQYGRYTN